MMKAPTAFALLVLFAAAAFPAPRPPAGATAAVVTSSVENMHRRSSGASEVVSQAILGTNVRLLNKERNEDGEVWYRVETPDTYRGWMTASALELLDSVERPYASSGKVFVVSSLLANLYREDDNTKHKPLKFAPISAVLEVVRDQDARWIEVNLPGDTRAWIQHGDGEIRDAPWIWPRRTAEETVALAKRFLGLPYLWGGTSPLGLDCSGLVQLVYKMSGIPLLRDARLQIAQAELVAVPPGEEAAGDLVFFGAAKDKITHEGIMVSSEEFINALGRGPMVRIDHLKAENWQKIYQGARRPKK